MKKHDKDDSFFWERHPNLPLAISLIALLASIAPMIFRLLTA